jgi:hypothetical protein
MLPVISHDLLPFGNAVVSSSNLCRLKRSWYCLSVRFSFGFVWYDGTSILACRIPHTVQFVTSKEATARRLEELAK